MVEDLLPGDVCRPTQNDAVVNGLCSRRFLSDLT